MSNLTPSMSPVAAPTLTVPGIFTHPMPVADALPVSMGPGSAPKTGSGLVSEFPVTRAGTIGAGVNDTFYNRILIEPAALDLGNLLSTQARSIVVWNGFLTQQSLSAMQTSGADGISISSPVTPPYTLRALELLTYVVNVTLDGPSTIDAAINWTIGGANYTATITGSRVVVWPFAPNWSNDFTESLEWKTDVLRAYAGSEQRRSLRTKPRRSFQYQARVLNGRDASRLESIIWGWQNRIFAMPVWSDKQQLAAPVNAGDTAIAVTTSTYSFTPGSVGMLFVDSRNFEAIEISDVSSGSLLLAHPLLGSWPAGTLLMPAVLAHLPTDVSSSRYTDTALDASLQFATSPDNTDGYVPDAAAPTLYNGIEVITQKPDWSSPIGNSFEFMFDTMDGGTGPLQWDATETYPRLTRKYGWKFSNRNDILTFRQLLGRRRGKCVPAYIPSWHQDFVVTANIGATDMSIQVLDDDFALMVGVKPERSVLALRLTDGTMYFRTITGVSTPTPGYTQLSIDSKIGVEINVAQIDALYLMMLYRLATDLVEIVWKSTGVATVETSFISIPA